jgi:hypothetical protein
MTHLIACGFSQSMNKRRHREWSDAVPISEEQASRFAGASWAGDCFAPLAMKGMTACAPKIAADQR